MIFLLKLSFLLFRPGDELLVFLALGMEGLVAECFADRPPVFQKLDRKSTRLNSSHLDKSRMPSSA